MSDLDRLESGLRRQLQGKTLLGEVAFEERQCVGSALLFKRLFADHGVTEGLSRIRFECPITFALWLVNEAFYSYDGGYWPVVLSKVGINQQPYSARLGAAFVDILERFRLPRFRRLNTHWSYLGPILAHCGIPRTRLPEFFNEVLPIAAQIGVGSPEELAELQQQLPSLRVSRSIEWFIRFGDTVSADFLRRCLDMYSVAQTGRALPAAAAFGLPDRVWREFDRWTRDARVGVTRPSTPRFVRPRLHVDPSQGVRLELPVQACQHSSLDWEIQIDAASPLLRNVPRFAGEGYTEAADLYLGAPFTSAMVRLRELGGRELSTWVLGGLPTDRPVMFFDSEDFSVLPGEVAAAPQGVLLPVGYSVHVRRGDVLIAPPVLSPLGRLPFGWRAFEASICDLTGASAVVLTDESGRIYSEIELAEQEAAAPRLVGETVPYLAASDRTRVFVGSAPTLQIPADRQAFDDQWMIVVAPISEHCDGLLSRIAPPSDSLFAEIPEGDANQLAVPLEQPHLLGPDPWGVFEVLVKGPLGQGARFRIAVVPAVRIEHDWSEWRQGTAIRATVRTRAEVATASASLPDGVVLVERERTPLRLKCYGYGGQRWSIPVDLHLPIPSWSVQDNDSAAHLTAWSSQASRFALSEGDGRASHLMLRTATPWGVPRSAALQLRYNDRELFSAPLTVDASGYASVDLSAFLASARQSGYSRTELRLNLELSRTVSLTCLLIERHWTVDGLSVAASDERLRVSWTERFPMQGRVLRVYSRLTPWKPPRAVTVNSSSPGEWEGPLSDVATEPGKYRLELGVEDEWNGTFTGAGSCDWDHGTLEDWRATPLYEERSVDGSLYHYLVNASDGTADTNTFYIGTDERGEELSTKLFLALQGMGSERAGASRRLERLLSRVWLWPLLRGLLASAASVDPRTLLELGVLAQTRTAHLPGLSEHQADQLWRLWPPLGAWADLHALREGADRAAEARFVRWMGEDALRQLGPVATGGRLCVFGTDGNVHRRARLLEIITDDAVSPFDYHALRAVLKLRVLFDGERTPRDVEVINGVLNDVSGRELGVEIDYPQTPSARCPYPEQVIVELVKRGLGPVLKGQEAHCKPFPTSPIGQEAFQAAGFEWAIAAAEQPGRSNALIKVCREVGALVRSVGYADASAVDPSFERLRAELAARTHPLQDDEPLLGVHQASWLVASSLMWRSTGRHFVSCAPHQLVSWATALYDLAPRLFAHDLMKVCAIEALLAAKAPDAARSSEAHS